MTESGSEAPDVLYARLHGEAASDGSTPELDPVEAASAAAVSADREESTRAARDLVRRAVSRLPGRKKGDTPEPAAPALLPLYDDESLITPPTPERSVEEELAATPVDEHLKLDDKHQEAIDRAVQLGDEAFDRLVQAKIIEELRRLEEQQTMLALDKKDAISSLNADERDVLPGVVAHYDDEIKALQRQREAIPEKVKKQLTAEREELRKRKTEHVVAIQKFQKGDKDNYKYEPSPNDDPEHVAIMASAASELMRKNLAPTQVNEYTINDKDGNVILMQRLVFNTQGSSVIVEDWDKTNGQLKRQIILKGRDTDIHPANRVYGPHDKKMFVTQKVSRLRKPLSGSRARESTTFNEEIYKEIGLLPGSKVIASEKGLERLGGLGYSGRLIQAGVDPEKARSLADANYKAKKSKGFIAMLEEGLFKRS